MAELPRILIVIKGLGPGGAERLVVDQLRNGADSRFRYELFVCTSRTPNLLDEVGTLNVPIHLGYKGRNWVSALRRTLKAGTFDIVHAHLPVAASGARIAALSIRPRPKLVYTEHNRWPAYRLPTRWLNRATIALDSLDIAVSRDAASTIKWPARQPPTVITHGINRSALGTGGLNARSALRQELRLESDQLIVGTVANFRKEKDQANLLRAFKQAELGPAASLVIIGQGPLEAELTALRDELGLGDSVTFMGYRSDATALMAGFDIFTLPSAHEGRPVALMEAMALGLPCIVTEAGGMVDMVTHGESGMVVPVGQPGALARSFQELLADEALRDELGDAARSVAANFDGSLAFEEIERLYSELAGEG